MAITNSSNGPIEIVDPRTPGADDSRAVVLIKDNTPGYGDYVNQNFIRMTENFASDDAPGTTTQVGKPLRGQIWYDTSGSGNLRVLTSNADVVSINDWKTLVKKGDSTEFNELTTQGDTTLGSNINDTVVIRGSARIDASTTIRGHLELVDRDSNNKSNLTVPGDLNLRGNLIIDGDVNSRSVNTLSVDDNKIILNSGVSGTPNLDAGIEVNRGSAVNKVFLWDETAGRFRIGDAEYSNNIPNFTNLSDVVLADEVSETANSMIVKRDVNGNFSAGIITATGFSGPLTGNADTVSVISGHGIEGLSNVTATNRDATNRWLKWDNDNSRYDPAVIVWDDISDSSISRNDSKFNETLDVNKGGTGRTSLAEVKTWLDIDWPKLEVTQTETITSIPEDWIGKYVIINNTSNTDIRITPANDDGDDGDVIVFANETTKWNVSIFAYLSNSRRYYFRLTGAITIKKIDGRWYAINENDFWPRYEHKYETLTHSGQWIPLDLTLISGGIGNDNDEVGQNDVLTIWTKTHDRNWIKVIDGAYGSMIGSSDNRVSSSSPHTYSENQVGYADHTHTNFHALGTDENGKIYYDTEVSEFSGEGAGTNRQRFRYRIERNVI